MDYEGYFKQRFDALRAEGRYRDHRITGCGQLNLNLHAHADYAPPRSWEQFEELCADVFQPA